jgi:hypothetical protein
MVAVRRLGNDWISLVFVRLRQSGSGFSGWPATVPRHHSPAAVPRPRRILAAPRTLPATQSNLTFI